MLHEEGVMEIWILHRQGVGIRAIARQVGVSRNTVRKYMRFGGKPRYAKRAVRGSRLDPYKSYIQERLAAACPAMDPGAGDGAGASRHGVCRQPSAAAVLYGGVAACDKGGPGSTV